MADTELNLEAERAAFEAWAKPREFDLRRPHKTYHNHCTDYAWMGWQAARAATKAAAPADAPKRLSEHEVRMIALDHITSGSVGERYEFDAQGLDAFAIDIMNRCRATSVPAIQGWKLVPIEPTHEMVMAGAEHTNPDADEDQDDKKRLFVSIGRACIAYDAMLSAAPSHPSEAKTCTCPSGDGSLRWPCQVHPSEAKAGEDA